MPNVERAYVAQEKITECLLPQPAREGRKKEAVARSYTVALATIRPTQIRVATYDDLVNYRFRKTTAV